MNLTAPWKLLPPAAQAAARTRTRAAAHAACTSLSNGAWTTRTCGTLALQTVCAAPGRAAVGRSAQRTIRASAQVGDADTLDQQTKRTVRPRASIADDDRILSFAVPD